MLASTSSDHAPAKHNQFGWLRRVDRYAAIFTYSKSPGRLSMPPLGGAIHDANLPGSDTGCISEVMKSPSLADGSQLSFCFCQAASSISSPEGVACTSLNSPMSRWNATCGKI